MNKQKIVWCFLLSLSVCTVQAQETSYATDSSKYQGWNFRVGPYFWLIGLKGTIERPPTPTQIPEPEHSYEIDKSFAEIKNALKFAFLIQAEYRGERFFGILHITSFILQGEAITPLELVLQDSEYRFSLATGEIAGGYQILKKRRFHLDGIAGMKSIYSKIEGKAEALNNISFSGNRDLLWVDPILGIRLKYMPHPRLEFAAYGDTGIFPFDNNHSYQFIGSINFLATKWLYLSPGYRFWSIKGKEEEAIYNGQILGFYVRAGVQF